MKKVHIYLAIVFGLSLLFTANYFFDFKTGARSVSAQSANPGNADAIAVRIIPNPNHYSISRWYESQGFQGSPQALIVDGYEAIRDGRTVYVNVANIDQANKIIYSNIYLISYNQDSTAPTADILGQIISHWKFNDNIIESSSPAPSCSLTSLVCASDSDCPQGSLCNVFNSCALRDIKNCRIDSDCPANFFCESLKAKVARDLKRTGRLEELREALFNFKKINKHYPLLTAGTYLANNSLSVWPSWSQSFLTDLAVSQNLVDPINKLGHCAGKIIKNGRNYATTTNTSCLLETGNFTGSCTNSSWIYDFNITKTGSYHFWLDTSNANLGASYGDLSLFSPEIGAEIICSAAGVQHHFNIYLDGVLKGSVCNPAVNPDKNRQTGSVNLGNVTAGAHRVTVEWNNDWSYNPDGVWGTSDDADSNLRIYQVGVVVDDGYDPKTCWNKDTQKFVNNLSAAGSLILPAGSSALAYSTDSNGSKYNLCATLESSSASLGYRFDPQGLTSSTCVSDTGVVAGGFAGNTAPKLIAKSLVGEVNQPFNGYIEIRDAEDNPLTWQLDTTNGSATYWTNWKNNGVYNSPPILKDTTNANQKKIFAEAVSAAGTYNATLIVSDGQGGVLSTTTPLVILSSAVAIDAEDQEYYVNQVSPLNLDIFFSGSGLTASNYSLSLVSGTFNILSGGVARTITSLGNNKYQVNYKGFVSTARKFYRDTDFKYRITITSGSRSFTKDFNLRIKIENPNLDFNCSESARIGQPYECVVSQLKQGNHTITQRDTVFPAALSFRLDNLTLDYRITGQANTIGTYPVIFKASNEYGASTTKPFTLKINNYCGDGVKQTPNSEGRGGLRNDGNESCDGSDGVTNIVASSSVSLQYGCSTGVGSITPNPILSNNRCVYRSPLDNGGYCGDGYCQLKINGVSMEDYLNCPEDCANPCTPNCINKCAGASDGCSGTCPDLGVNNICPSNDIKSCSSIFSVGYTGNAVCKADCSGYDTSQCECRPSCVDKCPGADDGCGGTCTSSTSLCTAGETRVCTSTFATDLPTYCSGITMSGVQTCNSTCSGWSSCSAGTPDLESHTSTGCAATDQRMDDYACCELVSCINDGCDCCGRDEGARTPLGYNLVKSMGPCTGAPCACTSIGLFISVICECGTPLCGPAPVCSSEDALNESCKMSRSLINPKNWQVTTNHTTASYRCWK